MQRAIPATPSWCASRPEGLGRVLTNAVAIEVAASNALALTAESS
jgi:hypothetical protein